MAKGRILIVDDEANVAETIGAVLELDGYDVTVATSGKEALDFLERDSYDLVLTDLRLEDEDGLSILEQTRKLSPDTLTIMLTGYASLESAVRALREGAYDYLVKPCDVEELRATVNRGVQHRDLGLQLQARVRELEEANATIVSLNAELQRRVDEATAEVEQQMADLARAKKEIEELYRAAESRVEHLEEVDELKSRFISMASHELKTPLTAISGFAQILDRRLRRRTDAGIPSEEVWQEEQRVNLHQVGLLKDQSLKLARLVDDLLDVSRIESNKLELRLREVDIRRLASAVAERMQATAELHQIVVEVSGDGSSTCIGDEDLLEQVLNNLLSNALKYSPDGGRITVGVSSDASLVDLSVHDRGVGIPPDELEEVFSLFYQSSDRISGGGMGLGLYISREIITLHGGRIWAESQPNEGTTFHVQLPSAPSPKLSTD